MATDKTDQQAYSTVNPDEERDMGAKGGPSTTLGIPDDAHGISRPYDADTQTQLAAASTGSKKDVTNQQQGSVKSESDKHVTSENGDDILSDNDDNILTENDEDVIGKD